MNWGSLESLNFFYKKSYFSFDDSLIRSVFNDVISNNVISKGRWFSE